MVKSKQYAVYFGHPQPFWRERHRSEKSMAVSIEEMDILTDKVLYDSLHLQRAKGMQSTREDELELRMIQKLQMEERSMMQREDLEREAMWHQMLVNDVRRKEYHERLAEQARQQEMARTRQIYDEQIASASRRRNEAIRIERERENKRLDEIKARMEAERLETQRRKKEQQELNKKNFIEGHQLRMTHLHHQRACDRSIDIATIRRALDDLEKERQREYLAMKKLQHEKRVFLENIKRERTTAVCMESERDRVIETWQQEAQAQTRIWEEREAVRRVREKEEESKNYKMHLVKLNELSAKEKEERSARMQRVTRKARDELERNLRLANEELMKQMEYNQGLRRQVQDNQKALVSELRAAEERESAFTKKADMFQEVMKNLDKSPGRKSTNPMHPFKRLLDSKRPNLPDLELPKIQRYT